MFTTRFSHIIILTGGAIPLAILSFTKHIPALGTRFIREYCNRGRLRALQKLGMDQSAMRREMRHLAGDDLTGLRPGWYYTFLQHVLIVCSSAV